MTAEEHAESVKCKRHPEQVRRRIRDSVYLSSTSSSLLEEQSKVRASMEQVLEGEDFRGIDYDRNCLPDFRRFVKVDGVK